ncbi:MAG: IS3 family transposase, partial [Elusimicrobia bacterium]|nr:IS3 family transposase [Elusimicrobiota bacterium]
EGVQVNKKKVARIYREEKLSLRLKKRRKQSAAVRVPMPEPSGPNQRWSMDFQFDRLMSGRRFKSLNIVDDFTRECLANEIDFSIGGRRVSQILDQIAELRGLPKMIRTDNGSEFTSNAMDDWAHRRGVKLDFIEPGKPNQNAYVESFNGRFRDECLSQNQFVLLVEARTITGAWRKDYNEERPHGSLDGLTPVEFAERHTTMLNKLTVPSLRFSLV